jgi:general stress protein 26
MKSELDRFYRLIEHIDTAMMTTRRRDGHLQSRAMANQRQAPGADLWFVTNEGAPKLDDLAFDPHLNLSYYRPSSAEWVSASSTGVVSRDREKIRELWAPDWKLWFPEEGDRRHGTADDPRMVLIGVTVHAAVFLEVKLPKPILIYEAIKGWATGTEPDIGEIHHLVEPHRSASGH